MHTDQSILRQSITKIVDLSDEDLSLLLSCAEIRSLKKSEILLNEGELCRVFYFVEKGHLRTYYNKDGIAINLNFTFEGSFTTNLKCYKNRQPSDVIIEAGEDSIAWIINFRKISGQIDEHPQINRFVRRIVVNMLLRSEEHSNLFKIYTPQERYHYIEQHNPQLLQRISLSQLASYLGVARETLSRIRGKNH
ncbi:Crp/Fnr family transcriptional regulator [Chitinophagaceae bacterium MMS25-I14]